MAEPINKSGIPHRVGLIVRRLRRAGGLIFDRVVWSLDRVFDYRHGTDTSGIVNLRELDIDDRNVDHGCPYEPSPINVFKRAMANLPIDHREFVFIDIGSGKGRTLLLASSFPFARIIGVEFSEELHRTAQKNLVRYRSWPQRCADCASVWADASAYKLPDANLVIYLANPFDETVLAEVVRNIEEVAARRKVYLIYCEALFASVVEAAGVLPNKKQVKLPRVILRRPSAYSSLIIYSNQNLQPV